MIPFLSVNIRYEYGLSHQKVLENTTILIDVVESTNLFLIRSG